MSKLTKPEFNAFEINRLMSLGKFRTEYETARQLILKDRPISEGEMRWLWAVKRELRERDE